MAALGVFLLASAVFAQPLDSPEAAVQQARRLERRGHRDQSQELLRRAAAKQPKSELIALARADAYLNEENPFWALKVLGEFMVAHPPACASRALAARIHIQQANLDQAEQLVSSPDCDQPQETKVRALLLKAQIAELRGDTKTARANVFEARALGRRYEEDDDQLRVLITRYDPYRLPTASWNLDFASGGTSHGMAGVPADLVAPRAIGGSSLLVLNLRTRLVFSQAPTPRAFADAELRLTQLFATPNRSLSTRQPTLRIGLMIGREQPRLIAAYAYDFVHLEGGDAGVPGPLLYSEAHRAEYQLKVTPWVTAVGSVGGRIFQESDRTRFESEHGLVADIAVSETLQLTMGASWHVYKAQRRVFDQNGIAGLVGLGILTPQGFELRETISLVGDVYPASQNFFDPLRSERRKDLLLRIGAELWAPDVHGVRLGFGYDYTDRNSTAHDYDYADHRALLHLRWQSDSDKLSGTRISAPGRIPMRYDSGKTKGASQPKAEVSDVLRQDETVRRSSSCLK